MSGPAREMIERALKNPQVIRMEAGVPLQIIPNAHGKIVIYEPVEGLAKRPESSASWQNAMQSLFSLAHLVEGPKISQSRVSMVPLQCKDGSQGLFLLNSSSQTSAGEILFSKSVSVGDLAAHLAGTGPSPHAPPANRFAVDVPAYGVLPLQIEGLKEMRSAPSVDWVQESVVSMSELPGFDGGEALWNS
jgi:hypothetical protein